MVLAAFTLSLVVVAVAAVAVLVLVWVTGLGAALMGGEADEDPSSREGIDA